MRRAKSLLGLNVVSQEGKQLGVVRDLLFDASSQKLLGLLLEDRNLFGLIDAVAIPYAAVKEVGPHAVMIDRADQMVKVHESPTLAACYDEANRMDGKRIATQNGEELGSISDVFLEDDGQVAGYEISGGLFSDTLSGKKYLQRPGEMVVGADVVLVPQTVVLELERQHGRAPGGLNAVIRSAVGTNLPGSEVGVQLGVRIGKILQQAHGEVRASTEAARVELAATYARLAAATTDMQRQFMVGKPAGYDVPFVPGKYAPAAPASAVIIEGDAEPTVVTFNDFEFPHTDTGPVPVTPEGATPDSDFLIKRGQIITAGHVDRAIESNLLSLLLGSAVSGAARQAAVVSGDTIKSTVDQQQKNSSEYAATATRHIENAVLGKPAATEVIAPDGSVIVAPGMIITAEILALADLHGRKGEVIASGTMGAASKGARDGWEATREGIGEMWGHLTGKASTEVTHVVAVEPSQQTRIDHALGRLTNKVVLDRQDNVILGAGELITNAAVQRALDAEVLEVLLSAVNP